MSLHQGTRIWLSDPLVTYLPNLVEGAYTSPFTPGNWSDVEALVDQFKVYYGTIYRLSDYGYSYDPSYGPRYYPTATLELVEMLSDLSNINSPGIESAEGAFRTSVYMESPILQPGILPNGAHYNHVIEGFDGSYLGVIGYIRNAFDYAIHKGILT